MTHRMTLHVNKYPRKSPCFRPRFAFKGYDSYWCSSSYFLCPAGRLRSFIGVNQFFQFTARAQKQTLSINIDRELPAEVLR